MSFTDSLSQPLAARPLWGRLEGVLRHEYLAVDLFFILSGFVLTLYDQPRVRALPWTALFWLSLPVAVATMTDPSGRRLDNSLWAYLATMFIVFAAACASPRGLVPLTARVPVYLGEISFAIYIFHYPVLCTLRWLVGGRVDAMAQHATRAEARLVVLAGRGRDGRCRPRPPSRREAGASARASVDRPALSDDARRSRRERLSACGRPGSRRRSSGHRR